MTPETTTPMPIPEGMGEIAEAHRASAILAAKAAITLQSARTGKHFTYRVRPVGDFSETNQKWFVSLLTGPDNRADYKYLGLLEASQGNLSFRVTAKGCASSDAPSAKAFAFAVKNPAHEALRVLHNGHCAHCGRVLTHPESIETGLGPVCAKKA